MQYYKIEEQYQYSYFRFLTLYNSWCTAEYLMTFLMNNKTKGFHISTCDAVGSHTQCRSFIVIRIEQCCTNHTINRPQCKQNTTAQLQILQDFYLIKI